MRSDAPPRRRLPSSLTATGLLAAAALLGSALTARPAQAAATLNWIIGYAGDGGVGASANSAYYVMDVAQSAASSSLTYLNSSHVSNLNIALTPGSHTVSGFWADGSTPGSETIKFSFDSSGGYNLIATAAYTSSLGSIPSFSGTLSYDNGVDTVAISNFIALSGPLIASIGVPSVHSNGSYGGYQENESGFQVTFNVTADGTAAPEPASLAIIGSGLVGLTAIRRRLAKSAPSRR
jgi:hypothetical protein